MEEDGADNLLRRMERNGDDAIAVRYSSHVETRAELTLTPREPSPSPAAARLASRGDQRGRQRRAPLKGFANWGTELDGSAVFRETIKFENFKEKWTRCDSNPRLGENYTRRIINLKRAR